MRIPITAICLLIFFFSVFTQSWAQNCNPDMSREDKISKQKIDVWVQSLFSTGFGSSLMNTSEVGITATVGRYGIFNAINLQIQKSEESATNAAFESAYRAAVGKSFYFGFKSGDPVAFVVTDVSNDARVRQGLFSAKGVTTVVLSAVVSDQELAKLRNALTSRQIDAVRMELADDIGIEKSVSEKNGKKMMQKFVCFYQFLEKQEGISFVGADPLMAPAMPIDPSIPGKYVGKGMGGDFMQFNSDGTVTIHSTGRVVSGRYNMQAGVVSLKISNVPGLDFRKSGSSMVDPDGGIWEKQPPPPKAPTVSHLTIEQIIGMVGAKVPDDIIIPLIQKSSSKFELTPEALIKLKTAGVSDAVIRAMTQ